MSRRASACRTSSRRYWPRSFPSVVCACLPAGARAAGRLAGAVPRQRARSCAGARDRASSSPQVVAANPNAQATSISTGSSRRGRCAFRIDQDEARLLGLSSQALAARAQHRHLRAPDHPGARRHLSRRCRSRAPPTSSACRSTRCATMQVPLPNGRTVPLSPVRDLRLRAGLAAGLAARPRADPDRAGRRRAEGVLPETVVAALEPPIAELQATLAAVLPRSRPAARSRKAQSRRPRSSPSCRSCCSSCSPC